MKQTRFLTQSTKNRVEASTKEIENSLKRIEKLTAEFQSKSNMCSEKRLTKIEHKPVSTKSESVKRQNDILKVSKTKFPVTMGSLLKEVTNVSEKSQEQVHEEHLTQSLINKHGVI